jgi:hypothetical protein
MKNMAEETGWRRVGGLRSRMIRRSMGVCVCVQGKMIDRNRRNEKKNQLFFSFVFFDKVTGGSSLLPSAQMGGLMV